MKSILKLMLVLLLMSVIGCGEKGKQANTSDPVALKTQREALDQAKQVESTLQDAAAQQRKAIDESAKSQEQ